VNSPWISLSHAWLAAIYVLRGRFDEAMEHAETSIAVLPPSAWTGLGHAAKAMVLAAAGRREECLELMRGPEFASPAEAGVTSAGQHFAFHAKLYAAGMLGDRALAEEIYADHPRTLQYRLSGFDLKITERLFGMVALTAGRIDDAERHLRIAQQIATELPNRMDAPHVEYWLARLCEAKGEVAEARDHATAARDEFARVGAPPFVTQAEELLARLG
jgi:tetratricopeptide (TPR) repeat protein